jgi:hypothetical protein
MTAALHSLCGLVVRVKARLRNELARMCFVLAAVIHGGKFLTFSEVRLLARIPSSYDALSQWQLRRGADSKPTMPVAAVRKLVFEGAANPYSLGTEALNFVDDRIRRLRPNGILELGSGVSTVVIAACMSEIHGDHIPRVFSIDESETYLHETAHMLNAAGFSGSARLACRKVRDQRICGHRAPCYDLDDRFLQTFLDGTPDLLVVDGPSGGGLVRFGTLPLVFDHIASPCTFFLDDALRTEEIHVASLWWTLPEVRFRRVHLVGHGLLEGVVGRAERSE